MWYTTCESPLGRLTLTSGGDALTGLYLPQSRYRPAPAAPAPALPVFLETEAWLDAYFDGRLLPLPRLAPGGTPFQQRVWQMLLTIPLGQTCSYGQIACACFGRPVGAQAVGQAVGRNPVAILIPCHRVLGADGSLTGYGGGAAAKRWLLQHEAADFPL